MSLCMQGYSGPFTKFNVGKKTKLVIIHPQMEIGQILKFAIPPRDKMGTYQYIR